MEKKPLNRFWNAAYLSSAAIAIVCGFLGAITGISVSHQRTQPISQLATVEVRRLIQDFVKEEAKISVSPPQHQARVQAFSQALNQTLQDVAREKQVILLPEEAVLVGSIDVTPLVEQRLRLSFTKAGQVE